MMPVIRSAIRVIGVAASVVALTSCSDSNATDPGTRVRQSLIGTWTGTIKVDQASTPVALTLFLRADSTMLAEVPYVNPNCAPSGTWTASLTEMTATGRDCQGVAVTWVGLISVDRLRGTFTTSTTLRGTFDVERKAQ